jgi:hypothetical protein
MGLKSFDRKRHAYDDVLLDFDQLKDGWLALSGVMRTGKEKQGKVDRCFVVVGPESILVSARAEMPNGTERDELLRNIIFRGGQTGIHYRPRGIFIDSVTH